MKKIRALILVGVIVMAGCATTPYQEMTEKRINSSLSQAEEYFNLGLYASAALAFEKVVQLAVVEQRPDIMTRAQFKFALSLERCFAHPGQVQHAWDIALNYAQTYNLYIFDITLGKLSWQISNSSPEDAGICDAELDQFGKESFAKTLTQKIQWLNLSAKCHMAQGMMDDAWENLDDAMALLKGKDKDLSETKELDQVLSLTLFNRAMVLVGKKQFSDAMGIFNRSLAMDVRNNNVSGVYANLHAQAKLFDAMGEKSRAQSTREQLIQVQRYMTSLSY